MPSSHTVEIPAELLPFLFTAHADAKKNKVRQWLKHGAVCVNGKAVTQHDHPLKPGDEVSIRTVGEVKSERALPPGLVIRHEDDDLMVIEKPAGLLSMASAGERDKTAQSFLTHYLRAGNSRSRDRVWVVHRLDRATSGLLVFAKSEQIMYALKTNWPNTIKRYLAVVEGCPPSDEGVFESHLDESHPTKVRSTHPSEKTRHSVTHFRVLHKSTARIVGRRGLVKHTLVELSLETGRRNQIRVHLADAGCPVVGDATYGAKTDPTGRLALHATYFEFTHPTTGERLKFESPLPKKLVNLCPTS